MNFFLLKRWEELAFYIHNHRRITLTLLPLIVGVKLINNHWFHLTFNLSPSIYYTEFQIFYTVSFRQAVTGMSSLPHSGPCSHVHHQSATSHNFSSLILLLTLTLTLTLNSLACQKLKLLLLLSLNSLASLLLRWFPVLTRNFQKRKKERG